MRIIGRHELHCKCGRPECTAPKPALKLWYKLNMAAIRAGVSDSIWIRCGSRCNANNFEYGGGEYSTHKAGKAADVVVTSLTDDEKVRFANELARANFAEIGARPGFIHISLIKYRKGE